MRDTPPSRLFTRLATATTVATYLLILVGALVRASGAGLGCPDWPRCYGRWIPPLRVSDLPPGFDPAEFNAMLTWTEYGNRLLGISVGLLIFATLAVAWRRHRHRRLIFWPSLLAFLTVGFEGWLGGQVVRSGLHPWMITAHLLGALVVVSLLLLASFHARRGGAREEIAASEPEKKALRLTLAATALLLVQISLGTQVRAGIEEAVRAQPDLARGQWLSAIPALDFLHRGFSQVVLLAVVVLYFWMRRHLPARRHARRSLGVGVLLTLVQLGLGGVLAHFDMPAAVQVLHLSAASLLLGTLVWTALELRYPPDVGAALPRDGREDVDREVGAADA